MSGSFGGQWAGRASRARPIRAAASGSLTSPSELDRPTDANRPAEFDEPLADPLSVARSIGLDLLTAAPKTRAQLAEAMRKRGVPKAAADEVLDRFSEVGLVDDAAFAVAWVRSRQAGRGLAPRALIDELRRRGVAESLIADAVAGIDHDDIDTAARALVLRHAQASAGQPIAVRIRRLTAMLGHRGYSGAVALRVVREVLSDAAAGDAVFVEADLQGFVPEGD